MQENFKRIFYPSPELVKQYELNPKKSHKIKKQKSKKIKKIKKAVKKIKNKIESKNKPASNHKNPTKTKRPAKNKNPQGIESNITLLNIIYTEQGTKSNRHSYTSPREKEKPLKFSFYTVLTGKTRKK